MIQVCYNRPVSYTHLDVYKRQVQTTVGTSEPGKSVLDTEAASESGILGCDGTGLVSERDPGQYLQ